MNRLRRKTSTASDSAGGFAIADPKTLGSSLASALGKHLDLKHLRPSHISTPRGLSLRIANAIPLYRDENQQYPVLQLSPTNSAFGAYLEVALDYQFVRGECGVTHISLKVHTGPSPRSSSLRFRAEWDPRDEAKVHAQPHWNIDQAGAYASANHAPGSAAPWIPEPKTAPWAISQSKEPVPTMHDLRRIHFAMGSSWHLPTTVDDGKHSMTFADEAAIVRWVSGCAAYIQAQLMQA
jgi:hypothetical protein